MVPAPQRKISRGPYCICTTTSLPPHFPPTGHLHHVRKRNNHIQATTTVAEYHLSSSSKTVTTTTLPPPTTTTTAQNYRTFMNVPRNDTWDAAWPPTPPPSKESSSAPARPSPLAALNSSSSGPQEKIASDALNHMSPEDGKSRLLHSSTARHV